MMNTPNTQKEAAKAFAQEWSGKGYEKGETQRFWLSLLHTVFGIDNPMKMMEFELPVKTITKEKGSDFIDAYIPSTKVLIEQKGSRVNLADKFRQSDGQELTPYQQARRYAAGLPVSMTPRWIVACNFREFEVHDMERPNDAPEVIRLEDLEKECHRLSFLVDDTSVHIKKELEVSMAAGRIIGEIYDAFLKEYRHPDDPHTLRSLNILCVRLVFCLYAEDAGLFSSHSQFHDYLVQFKAGTGEMRKGLLELFDVLNTPLEERDPYLPDDLLAFPYVNGGLFAEGGVEVPRFTEAIANLLLQRASDDFDWSQISPTIFGGVFESTLNPETRRSGGMHYTSIENIHKVIDPLFLDDLKKELDEIKAMPVEKKRISMAQAYQDKLASLKFLDPACGSGNFLTETFLSLRRLENEAIRIIYKGQMMIGEFVNPIKVSINQFYGIEINDFAVSVAMTALWIAEAQMLFETEKIMQINLDFLPLKSYTNIHEGNALRMDWNEVVPASELSYIMGNPPFVANAGRVSASEARSKAMLDDEQKKDKEFLFGKDGGQLDYVSCWFKKASLFIEGTSVRVAFVATDSICQGQQVGPLWSSLLKDGVIINFAHRSFKWQSESKGIATVFVIIIGFSKSRTQSCIIYDNEGRQRLVNRINPYLVDADDIIIASRSKPICNVPIISKGSQPTDGGNLILSEEEALDLCSRYPDIKDYIRPFVGAEEFLRNKKRFCLWLQDITPRLIKSIPDLYKRVEAVRECRTNSSKAATRAWANYPTLFTENRQPDTDYIVVPSTTSGNRSYVPIGFLSKEIICSNLVLTIPNGELYHFGTIQSSVHMAWMRAVCGYFGPSYRYSAKIVYNNFPWVSAKREAEVKESIAYTAQSILDIRAHYPDSCLADLYDDLTMPPELRKAHRANDAAVMEAYGFRKDMTEPEIVAELFKMYQKLTEN